MSGRSTKNRPKSQRDKVSSQQAGAKTKPQKPASASSEKARPSGQSARARNIAVSVLCLVAITVAVYTLTAPLRARYSLKTAPLADLQAATLRDPNNVIPFYYLGLRWRQLGQPASAEKAFRRAADLDNDDAGSWIGAALADSDAGNLREGLGIVGLFVRQHPKSSDGHFTLGQIYDKMGSAQNGNSEALAATGLNAHDSGAWRLAGRESSLLGNNDQAQSDFRRAIQEDPHDWRSMVELGRLLAGAGQFAEAESLMREAVQLAPTEALPMVYLGKILLNQAQTPADIETAQKYLVQSSKIQPNNAEVQYQLGMSEMRLGHWEAARTDLLQALRFAPADPRVLADLVAADKHLPNSAFLAQDSAHQSALNSYLAGLPAQIKTADSEPFNAQAVLSLARLCVKNGDDLQADRFYQMLLQRSTPSSAVRSEAEAARERAASEAPLPLLSPEPTALTPDEAPVGVLLRDANSLLKQGNADQAQAAFLSIAVDNIEEAGAYEGLGRLMESKGDYSPALFYYQKAVDFRPRFWQAQFEIAAVDNELGLYKESGQHYREGLAVVPNDAGGWHSLGATLVQVDDWYQDAEDAFRQAVKLDPKNAVYLRDLADLQVIRNEHTEAEANYRKALQYAPNDTLTKIHLASFLIVNRTTPAGLAEASSLLTAAATSTPNDRAVSYWQGRLALEQGNANTAIPALVYSAQHSHGKEAADAWYSLSRAFTLTGDRARAAAALKLSDRMRSLALYLTVTQNQVANDPNNVPARLKLATLFFQDNDYQSATDEYQNVLRFSPGNKAALAGLAKLNTFLKAHPEAAD